MSESGSDSQRPPVIIIRSGISEAKVRINGWLEKALREECTLDDGKLTAFDVWISSQMLRPNYIQYC